MAEFPTLPIFTDALIGDTQHLSAGEFGSYMLLLITSWRRASCDLPDDDVQLARIARCSLFAWRRRRAVLVEFFNLEEGFWRQKKLREVRAHVAKVSRIRSDIRKQRGTANPLNGQEPPSTIVPTKVPSIDPYARAESKSKGSKEESKQDSNPAAPALSHITVPPDGGRSEARRSLWAEVKSRLGGKDPGRQMGQWCRDYGEDAVYACHQASFKEPPGHYRSWMFAALKARADSRPDDRSPMASYHRVMALVNGHAVPQSAKDRQLKAICDHRPITLDDLCES